MIHRAIEELNEGAGSSEKAMSELIVREYENLPLGHEGILRHHLGKLCKSGEVMRMVDGRYSLRVDSGDVNKGVVVVEERKNRKKRRGRKRGVSRPSGVKDRGGEETNGGEIGEENGCIEQEIEGQTEAQGVRIDGIDEDKKGEEEREEVVGKLDQGNIEINKAVKEQSEAEKQAMEVTEEQIQVYDTFLLCFLMFLHMFALKLFDQPSMVKLDWGMNLDLQFKFCRKFEKERAVLCKK